MENPKDKELSNLYWRLAVHVDMAIENNLHLDSPTIPEEKIEKSNDEVYKKLARSLGDIAYFQKRYEEQVIAKINVNIESLIAQGADPSVKGPVIRNYFNESLQQARADRSSKSYCPACSHMYNENGINREHCKIKPGKEFLIYNCPDFKDFECMNWDKHFKQLDTEIKLNEIILSELEGRHVLENEKDYRIKSSIEKFLPLLK